MKELYVKVFVFSMLILTYAAPLLAHGDGGP